MKAKYSKKDLEIINKYGKESDKQFDSTRDAWFDRNGEKVSSLALAKLRKKALEENFPRRLSKFLQDGILDNPSR